MRSIEFKRRVFDEAIKKNQHVIDDFRSRIDAVSKERPAEEDEMDADQQAKISERVITELNPLGEQLEFADSEMKLLLELKNRLVDLNDSVQLGSIVVTDKDIFFVSTSIERFEADGKSLFGLSAQAPLYQTMRGKKKGDSFTYNKKTYKIKEVF